MSATAPPTLEPKFARHETFHPRYGWLKKAYDAVPEPSGIFGELDAPVKLGVGKNMVRAIRYWALAFKILKEVPNEANRRRPNLARTGFGDRLFGDEGWDPYLEDRASLWLLHWNLLSPPCQAPTWWVAFNAFHPSLFADEELEDAVRVFADAKPDWARIAPSAFKKDVSSLLRMYASAARARDSLEDLLDSPFREIGLIRRVPGRSRRYRFDYGEKSTLPDDIVAYACLNYMVAAGTDAHEMTLGSLASGHGSPGSSFRLPPRALSEAIERSTQMVESIALTDVGGSLQLVCEGDPTEVADGILQKHYEGRQRGRNDAAV